MWEEGYAKEHICTFIRMLCKINQCASAHHYLINQHFCTYKSKESLHTKVSFPLKVVIRFYGNYVFELQAGWEILRAVVPNSSFSWIASRFVFIQWFSKCACAVDMNLVICKGVGLEFRRPGFKCLLGLGNSLAGKRKVKVLFDPFVYKKRETLLGHPKSCSLMAYYDTQKMQSENSSTLHKTVQMKNAPLQARSNNMESFNLRWCLDRKNLFSIPPWVL